MTYSLIYLEVHAKQPLSFHKPLYEALQQTFTALEGLSFEADNFSDDITLNALKDLLDHSEHLYVIINTISEGTLKKWYPFFNRLLKRKESSNIYSIGESSAVLDKLLRPFGKQHQHHHNEKVFIEDFQKMISKQV
ncbi:hypothetical protein [Algivirga pacifica]|uniref:Uncharacterized protein n=1 Tax=Algivirga pacifica TaxID=1162670 RepID=A0ABP9DGQ7_9BACT